MAVRIVLCSKAFTVLSCWSLAALKMGEIKTSSSKSPSEGQSVRTNVHSDLLDGYLSLQECFSLSVEWIKKFVLDGRLEVFIKKAVAKFS